MNAPYYQIRNEDVTISYETKDKVYNLRVLPDGQVFYGINWNMVPSLPNTPGAKAVLAKYRANAPAIDSYLANPTNEAWWQLKYALEGRASAGGKRRHGARQTPWFDRKGRRICVGDTIVVQGVIGPYGQVRQIMVKVTEHDLNPTNLQWPSLGNDVVRAHPVYSEKVKGPMFATEFGGWGHEHKTWVEVVRTTKDKRRVIDPYIFHEENCPARAQGGKRRHHAAGTRVQVLGRSRKGDSTFAGQYGTIHSVGRVMGKGPAYRVNLDSGTQVDQISPKMVKLAAELKGMLR